MTTKKANFSENELKRLNDAKALQQKFFKQFINEQEKELQERKELNALKRTSKSEAKITTQQIVVGLLVMDSYFKKETHIDAILNKLCELYPNKQKSSLESTLYHGLQLNARYKTPRFVERSMLPIKIVNRVEGKNLLTIDLFNLPTFMIELIISFMGKFSPIAYNSEANEITPNEDFNFDEGFSQFLKQS